MRPLLQQRFAMVRAQNDYDALVGLSGGKDSSYVAFPVSPATTGCDCCYSLTIMAI